jgi:phosphatidylglycerol---prolipoprotein diacylglyceryl transferase
VIQITPDPILFQVGPIAIGWYALGYVVGLAVMIGVTMRELDRRGIDREHVWGAFLLVGALALVGGRLYHVIHEWHLYEQNPLLALLPIRPDGGVGFAGLGLFGGIAGAALGILIYTRRHRIPLRLAIDAVIPGTFFAQAIARWGNFFNQELYGPPTDAPWAIAIECIHRIAEYPCSLYPFETTGFHPLFFYESALNLAGGLIALYLSRRHLPRLRAGDLAAFWGIWYGATRTLLETFREGWNWTVGGIPTAQLIGIGVILVGFAWLAWNHRPGRPPEPVPVDLAPLRSQARAHAAADRASGDPPPQPPD